MIRKFLLTKVLRFGITFGKYCEFSTMIDIESTIEIAVKNHFAPMVGQGWNNGDRNMLFSPGTLFSARAT